MFVTGMIVVGFYVMFVGVSPVHAVTCPTLSTSGNGDTFSVVVTGADGSCPSTYSNSGITHYLLSTDSGQNPYTVTLSDCSGSNCPPTEIIIQGWAGNQIACGPLPNTPCSSSGPWMFNIDATVQAGESCDTAPVKVTGTSGQPVLILEAGTGGDCSGQTTSITTITSSTSTESVPQFSSGALPLLALVALLLPLMLLARKWSPALRTRLH
jgi:hypothetical protein